MTSRAIHGGDIARAAQSIGVAPGEILDFSANVNPLGLPARARERLRRDLQDEWLLSQYPDPDATELRTALGERLHVPLECMVVGAGADCLIHAAVRALACARCVIPVPAFAEYERAAGSRGCEVHRIPLADAAHFKPEPRDLVVINNPHNPTGACLTQAEMRQRIAWIRAAGAVVLADEAFVDYVPDAAITREAAAQDGIIAIRSLTKFFGCPGLRVGYAVASAKTARAVATQLPAWPVTTPALNALAEAVRDAEYTCATLEANLHARTALVRQLAGLGCRIHPPAANFVFFEIPRGLESAAIRARLLREHRILVRDCTSFEGIEPGRYLRVAVRRENENQRLIDALAAVFDRNSCQPRT